MAIETTAAVTVELSRRLMPDARIDEKLAKIGFPEILKQLLPIRTVDGLIMSVQASSGHYCTPRDSYGPWDSVEIGFPNRRVEEFMKYIDGQDSNPTETVYGYVPIETVVKVIVEAGGLLPESDDAISAFRKRN